MRANMKRSDSEKLLTIVMIARNDNYMGNNLWRVATSINSIARNIIYLGAEQEVEVIVSDWGSETPIQESLNLLEISRSLVNFLITPRHIAKIYDRDSHFSRPHAINTAMRRASGTFVMYTDADIFIPLVSLAKMLHGLRCGYLDDYSLDESFFWGSRHNLPQEFVRTSPLLCHVDQHIERHWCDYVVDKMDTTEYKGPGACLLMKKKIWFETTGMDESLIYWGWNDVDYTQRLSSQYRWDDLLNHGIKFFHLEHYQDRNRTDFDTKKKKNEVNETAVYAPNPANWGLRDHELLMVNGYGVSLENQLETCENDVFNTSEARLKNVQQIVESDLRYRDVAKNIQFDPHNFFTNQKVLTDLMTKVKPKVVCEIGSMLGGSARFFAEYPWVEQVVCVDHWDRLRCEGYFPGCPGFFPEVNEVTMNRFYEQFLANCVHAGFASKIFPLRLSSAEAARYCCENGMTFDLIYLDGSHATVSVKKDVLRWISQLSPGGILCGDDWSWQTEPYNVAGAVVGALKQLGWKVASEGNFWLALPPRLEQ